MEASISNTRGFTLVEISIVMIIIGLLIGGTFGGMKLIDNMQVNKTVQDLKAIESAALTFRDTYGRLPGDMPNTAARLPSCTDAPCATGGNGDRRIVTPQWWVNPITDTSENFTFWHHLRAADVVSLEIKNTLDMSFGEGQPNSPMGDGFRITDFVVTSTDGCRRWDRTLVWIQGDPSGSMGPIASVNCNQMSSVDRKLDDGLPNSGMFVNSPQTSVGACAAAPACDAGYRTTGVGFGIYDLRGF